MKQAYVSALAILTSLTAFLLSSGAGFAARR